ncbi:MAG: hypothetical protein ACOYZ7_18715 [Chloroflexota bacterium]
MHTLHVPRLFSRNRSPWRAVTITGLLIALLFSPLGLGLAPVLADGENLLSSDLTASQSTLGPGEELTFTVTLRNTGSADAIADVTVVLPSELAYVAGSVTGGGSLEEGNVVWSDVPVAAGGEAPLAFRATPAVTVSANTTVTTVAAIMSEHLHFMRFAQVTLVPSGGQPPAPVPNLSSSYKSASKYTVVSGDALDYTIHLYNSGTQDAVVDVVDYLPTLVDYVSSPGGTYDATDRSVTWSDVDVPAGDEVLLTVGVTAQTVSSPIATTNVATITSGGDQFERQATVLVVPDSPPPMPNLTAYKSASKTKVASGETLSYTIHLHNSGTDDAVVDVVDELPELMEYVSASNGGLYHAGDHTVAWDDVSVPAGEEVLLTIKVTAKTVDASTLTVNTATITADGDTLERHAMVKVVPETPAGDVSPPVVQSLTIGAQDVLTDPDVTLYLSASDDEGVAKMYLEEWLLVTSPAPHWERVAASGWVAYATEYAWSLEETSGTHYVAAWVADAAGNKSGLGKPGLDFASLLLPGESLSKGGIASYLVYYDAGVDVTATLDTLSGDADLYVWFPGHHALPDAHSNLGGTATDQVSFTTATAGAYLFVVHGWEASTFDLDIVPGGGPRASMSLAQNSHTLADMTASDKTQLQEDPVLTWSGLDPLTETVAPKGPYTVYLPVVSR